jgi:hypothetical protein
MSSNRIATPCGEALIKYWKGTVISSETVGQISVGWKCSTCGQSITHIDDGWVEWLAFEDHQGRTHLAGLRLIHCLLARTGKRGPRSCQYDARQQFRRNHSLVEGLPLERFVGPDGLTLLLSFIAVGEMPLGDTLELAKRVQIPGYELVRDLLRGADHKFSASSIGEGFHLQSEIQAMLASYGQSRAS